MSVETFADRLLDARKAAGYGESPTAALKALRKAERSGWGKAPSDRQRIYDHEDKESGPKDKETGPMPGADVVLCYAAAYGVNPIWLVEGIGPREWDPDRYRKDSRERFAAEIRTVARWMLRESGERGHFREILAGYDEPTLKDLRDGKDGEAGTGAVGTPPAKTG